MNVTRSFIRSVSCFTLLVAASCSAVWSVDHYLNQDGTPHLYNAYLIVELVKGNSAVDQFASLNIAPNLTGHWLLAGLLLFFAPALTTKIFVTFTFAAIVASVGWLRSQVSDGSGVCLSMLFGTLLAFNWMWFLGFYNFSLSVAAFAFTLGLWWRWREQMGPTRACILLSLFLFTFFSHLISFGLLLGSIMFLLVVDWKTVPQKSTLWTVFAVVSAVSLPVIFMTGTMETGPLDPNWTYLQNPFSISDWGTHLIAADPFLLISRTAMPFIADTSPMFAVFSAMLWGSVFAFLLIIVVRSQSVGRWRTGWAILSILLVTVWLFGPDDFGRTHGSFLRERTLVIAGICAIPLVNPPRKAWLDIAIRAGLILIIAFQTLVLWEYAHRNSALAPDLLAAKENFSPDASLASIVFLDDTRRFRAIPMASSTTYLGIGNDGPIWDNYEFGYDLFPVVAKTPELRRFVFDLRDCNTYDLGDPNEDIEGKKKKLEAVLAANHDFINVLLVWNEQDGFAEMRQKWFESEPYYASGKLQLFHHR